MKASQRNKRSSVPTYRFACQSFVRHNNKALLNIQLARRGDLTLESKDGKYDRKAQQFGLDKGDRFGPHLDLSVRSIQRRCYFAAAGRAGGIMKPSTTDKGGALKNTTYFTGRSGKCYDVATKILRTPQAINNDRSLISQTKMVVIFKLFFFFFSSKIVFSSYSIAIFTKTKHTSDG